MDGLNAVLFDLDGTLHDRRASVTAWLDGHARRLALPAGYGARFLELDDHGYRSKAALFPQLIEEFELEHGFDALYADFEVSFYAAPCLMPHALDVLRELRRRGLRLGIVTNGRSRRQRETLDGLRLGPLVDDVLISEEVGLSKPAPAIYRLALSRLGVDAADAWFVGDSPRNDVWGPRQIGLRAAFLPTGHALAGEVPDALLADLRDVLLLA